MLMLITPTDHISQVEQVEIVDTITTQFVSSKQDHPVLVHFGE